MTVLTGVSGSGKSSLAFDTIYAEGHRQYLETFSPAARKLLTRLPRPQVELIDGIRPTLCIDQRPPAVNPRSTVGTLTEIHDYLRLLYARCGLAHCHQCGQRIEQSTPNAIQRAIQEHPVGTKLIILAPIVRAGQTNSRQAIQQLIKTGLLRARVGGEMVELSQLGEDQSLEGQPIEGVIDRLVIKPGLDHRLAEAVTLATRLGDGSLMTLSQLPGTSSWEEARFNTRLACDRCGIAFDELTPKWFSFNNPLGACRHCEGLGRLDDFAIDLVIPDWKLNAEVGLLPYRDAPESKRKKLRAKMEKWLVELGGDWNGPLERLTAEKRELFWSGGATARSRSSGLRDLLRREYELTLDRRRRAALATYRRQAVCAVCQGERLRPESLAVTIQGKSIAQLCQTPLNKLLNWMENVRLTGHAATIAQPIVRDVQQRLAFLNRVGVGYLTLDRSTDSLSGGELQRVRLATSIGTGLVNVCYVLDEPSVGLHPRDSARLIASLHELRDQGNTLILVEHDEGVIRAADWVIDLGPGAGIHGGRIVAAGTPSELAKNPASLTGAYLSGRSRVAVDRPKRAVGNQGWITLHGARGNNLQNVTARFPVGFFSGVMGVSGSGKSSLIIDTLVPAIAKELGLASVPPHPFERLEFPDQIKRMQWIDQAPIGRSPRSCPATFTGIFDEIRRVFAQSREAKQRGFGMARFSFNAQEGRCDVCKGLGYRKSMKLIDQTIPCAECHGARFHRRSLEVRYKGASIADVLEMTVDQGVSFLSNFPSINRKLCQLQRLGLGYLQLGQPAHTLSGGEAQRIKLATELTESQSGGTLYVLDEPTKGLHFQDVKLLLEVLQSLVDCGNTVIVIEHHLDVIGACDWLVEMGPEGGDGGGKIIKVAEGSAS